MPQSFRHYIHRPLRIATRNSELALWQANHVATLLRGLYPGISVALVSMTTSGDRFLEQPLARVGGKGLFVKELQQAMLDGRADFAVHSAKDVPMQLPNELTLGVIMERADPRDALVLPQGQAVAGNWDALLDTGAKLGTSSLRRRCQLLASREDLDIDNLRGNLNTRLARLDEGRYDGIILAAAGLQRLGLADRISACLPVDTMLPAAGQGVLALEYPKADQQLATLLRPLHHQATALCLQAERAVSRELDGGCQVPLAAHAQIVASSVRIEARIGAIDGSDMLVALDHFPAQSLADASRAGGRLARRLVSRGALELLAQARAGNA